MLKKIIAISLVAGALLFSGCGDTEGQDRLLAQNSIDQGDYSSAIAALENKVDKTDSDYIILASAHMGDIGFSTLDIITSIQTVDTNTSQDPLTLFKNSIIGDITDTNATLDSLTTAIDYYKQVVVDDSNISSIEQASDIQLQLGLAYMVKVSILLDDVNSDDNQTATTVNDAFNYISSVGIPDLSQDIDEMKLEAFNTTGDIDASMIDIYQSSL